MPANCCSVVPFTWLDARPVVAVECTPAVPSSFRQRRMRFRTRDFPVPAHPISVTMFLVGSGSRRVGGRKAVAPRTKRKAVIVSCDRNKIGGDWGFGDNTDIKAKGTKTKKQGEVILLQLYWSTSSVERIA